MERHRELYKGNSSILSPRVHNRDLQQQNRAKRRNDIYFSSRNISVSPTPRSPVKDHVEGTIIVTSTPAILTTKQIKSNLAAHINDNGEVLDDKENGKADKSQLYSSRIAIAAQKVDVKKRSRQEAYLMRFIEWKELKKKEEIKKKDIRKPFLPPSKNVKIGDATESKQSFVPKNYQFKVPEGLVDPAKQDKENTMFQKKQRRSLYTIVPTPPRKNVIEDVKKKTKTLTRRALIPDQRNIRGFSAERATSKTTKLGSAVKRPETIKTETTKRITRAVGGATTPATALTNKPLTLPARIMKPTGTAVESTVTTNIASKGGAIGKSKKSEQIKSGTNVLTQPEKVITKPSSLKLASNNNIITQPEKVITKPSSLKLASKTETTKQITRPVRSATNPVTALKNKPITLTARTLTTNIPSKDGAIGKVKKLQQIKQKMVSQKQNKLSVSLKAKKPSFKGKHSQNIIQKANMLLGIKEVAVAETPTLSLSNPFSAFVTSTQVKEAPGADSFPDITDEISPVKAVSPNSKQKEGVSEIRHQSVGSSVKRALLQNDREPSDQKRKSRFNFVRYSEAATDVSDLTVDEENISTKKELLIDSTKTTEDLNLSVKKNGTEQCGLVKYTEIDSCTPIADSHINQDLNPKKGKFNFVRYSEAATDVDNTILGRDEIISNLSDNTIQNEINKTEGNDSTVIPLNETPKSRVSNERPTNYLSPFVSVSRGKVSLKAEKELRNSIYLQPDVNTTPCRESAVAVIEDPQTPVEIRRTLETVRYFRKQLADEIVRLHKLCDEWEAYKDENLPRLQQTGGEDMINVTIGQTKLLTSKKFKQFNGLIDRCESGATGIGALHDDGSEDTKPITCIDLEGFWSMVGLQVDNVEKRFENLESWKANNWIDPDEVKAKTKKSVPKVKKTKAAAAVLKAKPNSALQQMMRKMQADMRKQKAAATTMSTEDVILTEKLTRRRQSQIGATPQQQQLIQQQQQRLSGTPQRRLSIIVPDRKSLSAAATIVSIPSPLVRRNLNNTRKLSQDSPKLRPHVQVLEQSLTKFYKDCDRNDLLKTALTVSTELQQQQRRLSTAQTPPTAASKSTISACPKSILKTPGTESRHRKSVIFNSKLQVRKFKFTVEDETSDEERDENQLNLSPNVKENEEGDNQDNEQRIYRLRGRKVVLRPSCEFEIPK